VNNLRRSGYRILFVVVGNEVNESVFEVDTPVPRLYTIRESNR